MFGRESREFRVSLKMGISGRHETVIESILSAITTYDSEVNLIDFAGAGEPVTVPLSSG